MASGDIDGCVGCRPHLGTRSRTGLVIDQLLSRGPTAGLIAIADAKERHTNDPWISVRRVFRSTTPSLLEAHLTWLVDRAERIGHLSPRRILVEDQVRILIRALEDGGEDDAITRSLEEPWSADAVPDGDDDIITYASALRRATESRHGSPPYVAVAQSAERMAAEILEGRRSSIKRRHVG
jgi:hypothetical protein